MVPNFDGLSRMFFILALGSILGVWKALDLIVAAMRWLFG